MASAKDLFQVRVMGGGKYFLTWVLPGGYCIHLDTA